MRIARILVRPAFARVSWGIALAIAVIRKYPWFRGEICLLDECYSRLPNVLCESKAIKADDKETACRITLEEFIRDRGVRLGRESHGRHAELDECLQHITN